MFSGGRGTASLSKAFVAHPQIDLFLLVNAYDDGLSSGRLRRFIPGLLGPSDIRKNIAHLIPDSDQAGGALKRLLEYRFSKSLPPEIANQVLSKLYNTEFDRQSTGLEPQFWKDLESVSYKQARYIETQIFSFLTYYQKVSRNGKCFEFGDCSIGNIIFSGAFLRLRHDFNQTISEIEREFNPVGRVLNLTQGENYVLVGLKSDGSYLCNETEIVSPQNSNVIEEIYLLENYLSEQETQNLADCDDLESKKNFFTDRSRQPKLSAEAKSILETADLIIYGPGTQHSSLFPSYLTEGVGEAISKNKSAEKVFIANTRKDHEIQGETMVSLCMKLHYYLSRKGEITLPPEDLVTRYFFQDPEGLQKKGNNFLNLESVNFDFPSRQTLITNWEDDSGGHSGNQVLEELIAIVNERAKTLLKPFSFLVTIVVPVLNEERTLETVLKKLNLLDLHPHGLGKEIIVVDGGSNDRSQEIAKSKEYVRFFDLPKNKKGRGAAIRYGVEKARGRIVVFFPSDDEYDPQNIVDLVMALKTNEYEAVFGSRSIKCLNLNERIRLIYKGKRLPYLISKYGGISISVLCLLLFNRFITDPLTGIKAFDRRLLIKFDLNSNGVELDTEIIAKLSLSNKYILEIPVEYRPRMASEGKKITIRDGLSTIVKLFKLRFYR
jgi:2-phospho-L-lactate transferase/gluconeogenesis factor (CofD/UPF0052 family)